MKLWALTAREHDVPILIATGLPVCEIGEQHFFSPNPIITLLSQMGTLLPCWDLTSRFGWRQAKAQYEWNDWGDAETRRHGDAKMQELW